MALKRSKFGSKNAVLVLAATTAAACFVGGAPTTYAANQIWSGGSTTDGNWSDMLNWNGAVPGSTSSTTNTDVATFNTPIANTWGLSGTPIVIDQTTQNIGGITFDTSAGAYTIGSTSGHSLLLSSTGAITLASTFTGSGDAETINSPIVLQPATATTAGTYSFTNNSTNSTDTLYFGGGITAGTTTSTETLTLNGANTGANTIAGVIGNGGATGLLALSKSGAGTWVLTGTNTYTGTTTLAASGGTLQIGSGGTLGGGAYAGAISLGAGSTLQYSSSVNQTLSGVISGTGTLLKDTNTSTLTLSGINTFSGSTTVSAGTLLMDFTSRSTDAQFTLGTVNVGSSGTLALFTNAALNYGSATALPINSTFTGSGTINKTGTGIVDFFTGTSLSAFTGQINVQAGILADQSGSFTTGSASLNVSSGAYFDLRTSDVSVNNLTGTGTIASSFQTHTFTIGALGGSSTFGGVIQNAVPTGSGGSANGQIISLTKSGSGNFTLNGSAVSTYTGATTINGGTLTLDPSNLASPTNLINSGSALKLGGGTLNILGTATGASQTFASLSLTANTASVIELSPNTLTAANTTLTITSPTITTGAGASVNFNYAIGGGTTVGSTLGDTYVIWSPTLTHFIIGPGYTVTDSGGTGFATVVGGDVVRLVDSGGTLGLPVSVGSATGTYFVNLSYDSSLSSPTTPGSLVEALSGGVQAYAISVDTTGTSATNCGLSLGANTLTIAGGGGIVFGGPTQYAISATTGGGITSASGGTIVFNNVSTSTAGVTIAAPITDTSTTNVTYEGTGLTILSGLSSYKGVTTLYGGTVNVDATETAGTSGPLGEPTTAVGSIVFAGGTLQYSSANTYDYSGRFSTAAGQHYSVDTNGQTVSWSTALTSSGGTLTKLGLGTLTLFGANTYSGGTTVNAGTLVVDLTSRDTYGVNIYANVVNLAGTLTFNNTDANVDHTGITAGSISGSGTLTKTGLGYVDIAGSSIKNFTGNINVVAGILASNNSDWASSAGLMNLNVSSGAMFDLRVGNVVINQLTGSGTIGTTYTQAPILSIGNNNGSSTFSGIIQNSLSTLSGYSSGGTVGVVKNGTGTIDLSGATTYTGGTTVNAGTLELDLTSRSTDAALNLGTISVATGSTLQLTTTASATNFGLTALTSTGTIFTGNGTITKTGVGIVDLWTGTQIGAFAGLIDVQAGTLSDQTTSNWSTSAGNMTLEVDTGAYVDLRTDNIVVNKLTGNGTIGSSYSAGMVLTVGAQGGSSTFSGVIQNTVPGFANTPTIGLTKTGTGTFTLTGNSTNTGAITVANGTLALAASSGNTLASTASITLGATGTTGLLQLGNSTNTTNQTLANNVATAGGGGSIVGGNASASTLTLTPTATTVFSTTIGGSGTNQNNIAVVKSGTSNLTLSGNSTFNDGTTVSGGILYLGGASGNALGTVGTAQGSVSGSLTVAAGDDGSGNGVYCLSNQTSGVINFNSSQYNYVRPNGFNWTVAGLNGPGVNDGVIENGGFGQNVSTSGTITINVPTGNSYTFAGYMRNADSGGGSGLLNVVMSGGGTQTLTGGSLSYTGSTTVNGGTLNVAGSIAGSTSVNVASGATLQVSATGNNQLDSASGATWTVAGTLNITGVGDVLTMPTLVTLNGGTLTSTTSGGATFGSYLSYGSNLGTTVTANGTGNLISSVDFSINSSSATLTLNTPLATDALTASTIFKNTTGNSAGGITKTGLGTATLTGVNTYTGPTTISAGTLLVNSPGSLASGSAVTVQNGGTLGGTGTINGAVTVQNGGTLGGSGTFNAVVGVNAGGTLTGSGTFNSLVTLNGTISTLDGASTLNLKSGLTTGANSIIDLGVGSSTSNSLTITGQFNASGTTTINITPLSGFGSGTPYTLATYGSTNTTATFNADVVLGTPVLDGYDLSLHNTGTALQLIAVSAPTAYWQAGDGVTNPWSTATWTTDAAGSSIIPSTTPGPTNDVIFYGTGVSGFSLATTLDQNFDIHSLEFIAAANPVTIGGTGSLQIEGGGITIDGGSAAHTINTSGGVIVNATQAWTNNSASLFTVSSNISGPTTGNIAPVLTLGGSGSGGILLSGIIGNTTPVTGTGTGQLALVVNSGGTVTLTGSNTYTGGTTISAGTLQIGNGTTIGQLGGGAVIDNGVLVFDHSDSFSLTNALSGNGSFNQIGSGTITITGTSALYAITGGTNVSNGTLKMDWTSRSNAGASFNGGSFSVISPGTLQLYANGSTNSYSLTALTTTGTSFTGSGTITKSGQGIVDFWNGTQIASFAGLIDVQQGTLANQTTTSDWGTSAGNMSLEVDSNAYFDLRTDSAVVNQLSGGGTIGSSYTAGMILTVGAQGGSSTFNGVIQNTVPSFANTPTVGLIKSGSGTIALAGANTYTGATTVSGGVLQLNNAMAVQDTTVTLSATNGLGFNNTASGGSTYTVAGLSGTSNEALTDVSSNAVTLQVGNTNATSSYSGNLSGGGAITKIGTGTFTLSGASSYTGGTTISAGTLVQGSNTATGSATTGAITLGDANTGSNNVQLQFTSGVQNVNNPTVYKPITVTANGSGTDTLTFNEGGAFVDASLNISKAVTIQTTGTGSQYGMIGQITGTGAGAGNTSVTYSAPSGATLYYGPGYSGSGILANTFSGNAVMTGGGTIETQNLAYINAAYVNGCIPDTASVTVSGSPVTTWVVSWGSETIDALNGGGNVVTNANISGTLTVGDSNGTGSFSGVLSNTGGFTKTGSGTQTLSGVNTYTGATTVNAGTLSVISPGSLANTAVTVSGTGTLGGTGTINNTGSNVVSINNGGTIAPGTTAAIGTLTTGSQTWNGGGTYDFNTTQSTGTSTTAASLTAGTQSFLTINGTLDIEGSGTPFILDVTHSSPSIYGGTFIVAQATTGITWNGSPADLANNTPITSDFTVEDNGLATNSFAVTVVSDSGGGFDVEISPVPEPTSLGLLGIASLGLLRRRRGTRKERGKNKE